VLVIFLLAILLAISEIADGLTAQGDARLTTIVLTNLLGNAWKYTAKRPESQIAFGQESNGNETVFYVRDNGARFDMAYADKLFAPFQRLHQDSEFQGNGIGLAKVQRIVSRQGGRVWAKAAKDKGATFFLHWEKCDEDRRADDPAGRGQRR